MVAQRGEGSDDVELLTGGGVKDARGRHQPRRGTGGPRLLPGTVPGPLVGDAAYGAALVSAAQFLRGFHDATAPFAAELPRDGWMFPAGSPVEVVVHGDYAPCNCVLDGDRVVGLVDVDTARPGPRIVDVATGAYRWASLSVVAEQSPA